MVRICALCGVLLMLAVCGVTAWVAPQPPLALFSVPGATDIRVVRQGWGAWQISYRAPGAPATWPSDVAGRLEAQHWSSPDRAEYGALTRTYNHALRLRVCELWEWAYLTFDPLRPHDAQITVRRWIVFPWWRPLQLHLWIIAPAAYALI